MVRAMPPEQRFVPRFAAEPPQERLPYGRWAETLGAEFLAACLRIFADAEGRMNEPLGDREALVVSQFTLYGDARRGNRPSWVAAAPPEHAEPLYERVRARLGAPGGVFGAHMAVALVNDGPVTLLLES